jgi:GDP-fucose transporter C1
LKGSIGEVNFSWMGVLFGVTSSAFVSLYGIYVKKVLPVVEKNEWFKIVCFELFYLCRKLLLYNNVVSAVFMIPFIVVSGEYSGIMASEVTYEFSTWVNLTITGVFGFLINIAVFLQIKYTSPLTNNISGTVKVNPHIFLQNIHIHHF